MLVVQLQQSLDHGTMMVLQVGDIDILRGKCSKDHCFHRQLMVFLIKHHNIINPKKNCERGTMKPLLFTARSSVRPQKDANVDME